MPIRLPTPRLITSLTPTWRWSPEARMRERNLVRLCFDDWMVLNHADPSELRLHVTTVLKRS